MNDFTKAELEAIRDNLVVPECFNQKSILYFAYQKIIGMIDNYCDHDFEYKDIGKAKLCTKCFSLLPIVKGCIEASTEPA